jgi:Transposase DDE domain
MTADEILERFTGQAPVAAMVRGLVGHLFAPDTLNPIPAGHELFTYTRSIAFADLVALMTDVVFRVHPSVRAAYRHSKAARAAATLKSFYEKVNHVEPAVCRALVRRLGGPCAEVIAALDPPPPAPPGSLRWRTLDGNTLAPSQRRPDGLEGTYAPLPGRALVLRDNATGLFVDVLACPDAYTNERALVGQLADWWRAGDVVAADSNFCTEELFRQTAARGAFLVARHHGSVGLHPLGPARRVGRTDAGEVWEQPVRYAGTDLAMRCVTVRLDRPTRAGDTEVRLLTLLPADRADARAVAAGYRDRRTIEAAFQELEAAVRSEVDTLAYPAAALFAFSLGLVLCNLLQVVRVALDRAAAPAAEPVSGVLLGQEVAAYLAGLLLLDAPAAWPQADWDAGRVAAWLRDRAGGVDRAHYARRRRGPKPKKPWRHRRRPSGHASTARILHRRSKNRPNAP